MQVEELIETWKRQHLPVVGVIVEPIQAEGGDHHGSNYFFQELRKLTTKVLTCARAE